MAAAPVEVRRLHPQRQRRLVPVGQPRHRGHVRPLARVREQRSVTFDCSRGR